MMIDLKNHLSSNAPGRFKLDWGGDGQQPIRYKINTTKQTAIKYNAMWTSAITKITQCKSVNLKKYIRMNVPYENQVVTISLFPTATVMFQGKKATNWAAQYLERVCRDVEEQIEDQRQELDLLDESDVSKGSTPVEGACAICDLEDDGEMVLCDYCFAASHINCAGLTDRQNTAALYYCKHCKFKYGLTDYTITVNTSTPIKDQTIAQKIDSLQNKDMDASITKRLPDEGELNTTTDDVTENLELQMCSTKPTQNEISQLSDTDQNPRSTNSSEYDTSLSDHHALAMSRVALIFKNLSLVQMQTATNNMMLDGLTGRLKNAQEIIESTSAPVATTEIENHQLYGEDKDIIIREIIHLERVRRKTEVHLIEARMEKESSDLNLLKALAEKQALEYKLKEIEVLTTNLASSMHAVSVPMSPGPKDEEVQQLKEENIILTQDNNRLQDSKRHLYGMLDAAKEKIACQALKEQQLSDEIVKLQAALRVATKPSSSLRLSITDRSTQTQDPLPPGNPSPNHQTIDNAKSKTTQPPKPQRNPSARNSHWLPVTEDHSGSVNTSPTKSLEENDIYRIQVEADIHHESEADSEDHDTDSKDRGEPIISSKDIHSGSDNLAFNSLHSRFTPQIPDKPQEPEMGPFISLHSRFTPKYPDKPPQLNIPDQNIHPINSSLYNGYLINNQQPTSTQNKDNNPWTKISPNHRSRNWKPVCKNYVQDKCFSENCIYYHPKNVIRSDRVNNPILLTRRFGLLSEPENPPLYQKSNPQTDHIENRTKKGSHSYNPYHSQNRNPPRPNQQLHTGHELNTSDRLSTPYSSKRTEEIPPPISPESIGSYLQRLSRLVDERSRLLDLEEQHSRPICKYHLEGRCKYGDRFCYNRHPDLL